METSNNLLEIFGKPISIYTRAQAIEDGVLVDLTEWASAEKSFIGGFRIPVAVSAAVWAEIERKPARMGITSRTAAPAST